MLKAKVKFLGQQHRYPMKARFLKFSIVLSIITIVLVITKKWYSMFLLRTKRTTRIL